MAAAPCKECGRRPKAPGRHRCLTCQLRHAPIGDQIQAARQRLAMVPPEMRVKRSKKILAQAPPGSTWCAGCQSFRDLEDFGRGATRCRPCASSVAHDARVAKVYGITGDDYDALLALQGGKCAICRARPRSKRLAVDHDHKTGAVRGLLCSRCNHDLMGSAWDSLAVAVALWHYLNTPPASGSWRPPETAPGLVAAETASQAVTTPSKAAPEPSPADGGNRWSIPVAAMPRPTTNRVTESATPTVLPIGSESVPGKRGVWRFYVEADSDAPF